MASRYVTRKGTERWRATWTVADIQQSQCGFVTREEAEAHEAPLRGDDGMDGFSHEAIEARARDTKLNAWLLRWWDSNYDDWTFETRRSYRDATNHVISPYIGNVRLYALTKPRIARLRDDALADGCTKRAVKQAMDVLSSALGSAAEAGYMHENTAKGVKRPRTGGSATIDPATPEDIERIRLAMLTRPPRGRFSLLDALRNATAVSLIGYGGLRPSEGWAGRGRHVDFEAGGIWQRDVFAGELREDDNKTHTPGRFIDLWTPVMDDLALYMRLANIGPDDYVLGDEDGNITGYTHRNWRERHFNRAKRAAAADADPVSARRILALTPYALRHSVVSIIARAEGRDLREDELADRMGHTIEMQRTTYRHVVRAQTRKPRMPVEEQILLARASLGTADALSACVSGIQAPSRPVTNLVNLREERRRRRAA